MTLFLLLFIYVAYIGLGLPDSVFGTAWPVIQQDLGVPISYESLVTVLISLFTITASIFSVKIAKKLGTCNIVIISTALTAVGLLGFSFANDMVWLCVLSLPLGLGAGAIDSALNNYVSLHYSASQMSFLHCFYGIGVFFSPMLLSFLLKDGNWHLGYRVVGYIQIVILIITIIAIPVWKRAEKEFDKNIVNSEKQDKKPVSYFSLIKTPSVIIVCVVFFASCALEFTCGQWGSSYLVHIKKFSPDYSAVFIAIYYLSITVSRFISGLLNKKFGSMQILVVGQIISFVAIVGVLLPVNGTINAVCMSCIGLGNGLLFPNLMHLTPKNFGKENAPFVVGLEMASSNLGVLLGPLFFSLFAEFVSIGVYPFYIMVLWIIMALFTFIFTAKKKNEKKDCKI